MTTCIKQFGLAKTMALKHGDHSDVKVSSSVRQFSLAGFKDDMVHPCAGCLHSATCKLQTLCKGPLAKLLARDLFFGFLWYNLGRINPNHVNLSFLNFQLTSPMGCCDRVTGTRQNSDCWSPLWWSWSSQAFAWPTTITGHVRHLGWLTGLALVQL